MYGKVSEEEKKFLERYGGGPAKAIRRLIEEKMKELQVESLEKEIEKAADERFYELILLPGDLFLRDTYQAFLERFILSGGRMGSLEYHMSSLCGLTGFDDKTIRKHFKKLSSLGFVKSDGVLFRPTLRLKEGVDRESFKAVYADFVDFLQLKGKYEDVSEDLWGA